MRGRRVDNAAPRLYLIRFCEYDRTASAAMSLDRKISKSDLIK